MTTAPATLAYSSGRMGDCPLCRIRPLWKKAIYGHPVCKKCYYGFANRRQVAYVLDTLIFFLPVGLIEAAVAAVLRPATPLSWIQTQLVGAAVGVPLTCLFICKDGFAGRSPGRRAMDVQVLDDDTAAPIGFAQSFKRNAVLLLGQIPVVGGLPALIVVVMIIVRMPKGYRLGDRFARTRVIWRRYAASPVFGGSALACEGCGYDLTGNTSGVCPECGAAVSAANAAGLAGVQLQPGTV